MTNRQEIRLEKEIERQASNEELMEEIDIELIEYKMKFGKLWLQKYMADANLLSKRKKK